MDVNLTALLTNVSFRSGAHGYGVIIDTPRGSTFSSVSDAEVRVLEHHPDLNKTSLKHLILYVLQIISSK